jgi:thiol-disulfide isomerase/thioredoxin
MLATQFHCPGCGALLKMARPLSEGKRIKCPRCGGAFSPSLALDRPKPAGTPAEQPVPTRSFPRDPGEEGAGVEAPQPTGPLVPSPEDEGLPSPTRSFPHEAEPEPMGKAAGAFRGRENEGRRTATPERGHRLVRWALVGLSALVVAEALLLAVVWIFTGPFQMRGAEGTSENTGQGPSGGNLPAGAARTSEAPPDDDADPKEQRRLPVSADGTPWLGVGVGNRALEIEGEDLDGQPFKLSDHHGKVVLLDFWGDWCPFCKMTYPYEIALAKRQAGKPFALLGVNSDRNKADVRKVVEDVRLPFRSWWDGRPTGAPIARQWNVREYPTYFVIDHKGIVRRQERGVPRDKKPLDDLIDRLVAEAQRDAAPPKDGPTPQEKKTP